MTQVSFAESPEQALSPSGAQALPEPQVRYVRQVSAMLEDADPRTVEILAETLAWGLAVIATQCGVEASGYIMQRLGGHISRIVEHDRAEAEAKQARKEGQAFQ